jgi:hypothetical protein
VPAEDFGLGLGPPLYAMLGAMALGQVLSCFRWLLVDQTHRLMGVNRPAWEDSQLDRVLGAFDYLVQSHYRYYEFCGNTLLAVLAAYGLNRTFGTLPFLGIGSDLAVAAVAVVLFAASRSALTNYYTRTRRLIGVSGLDVEISSCTTETTTVAVRDPRSRPPKSRNRSQQQPLRSRSPQLQSDTSASGDVAGARASGTESVAVPAPPRGAATPNGQIEPASRSGSFRTTASTSSSRAGWRR